MLSTSGKCFAAGIEKSCYETEGVLGEDDSRCKNDNDDDSKSVFYIKNIMNTCKVDTHAFSFDECPVLQLAVAEKSHHPHRLPSCGVGRFDFVLLIPPDRGAHFICFFLETRERKVEAACDSLSHHEFHCATFHAHGLSYKRGATTLQEMICLKTEITKF